MIVSPGNIKLEDFGLLICLVLIPYAYTKDKNLFNTKHDSIGKIIKILIAYYFLCAILSQLRGKENIIYSLMLVRFDIFYLSYFLFKKIPLKDISVVFKKLIYINLIGGILYYLQFIGITGILLGAESSSPEEIARYSNTPFLSLPIFLYLITTKEKIKYKPILILFYCGLFILPMSRGVLIATIFVCLTYFLIKKKVRLRVKHFAIVFLLVLIFKPIISYRFSSEGSTGSGTFKEIFNITSYFAESDFSGYNSLSIINDEGTFTFRMLMVAERLKFLLQSPISLLLGEGTIHESSQSIKKYAFNIGTVIKDNDDSLHMQQIDTNDVAFISHLFRYGFIYLVLYFIFLSRAIKSLNKADCELYTVTLLFLSIKIVQSLGSDSFSTFSSMFFILAVLAQTKKQGILTY